MPAPTLELADIFRQYGPAYRQAHSLPLHQHRLMQAIETCRTPALGGSVEWCDHCQFTHIRYRSCRNRHCPKCQGMARAPLAGGSPRRTAARRVLPRRLHPTRADRRPRLLQQRSRLRHPLPRHRPNSARHCRRPQRLGVEIGFFAVLHSWGQNLHFHPHLHCVVPGGGLSPDHERWIAARRRFLLPVRVLSRLFRRLVLEALQKAHAAGTLQFFGRLESSARSQRLRPITWLPWNRKSGWSMPSLPSADPPTCSSISAATLTGSPSPTTACWRSRTAKSPFVDRLPRLPPQGDDRARRGVHPPLPPARPARWFPAHPLLRLPGQLPSRQTNSHSVAACWPLPVRICCPDPPTTADLCARVRLCPNADRNHGATPGAVPRLRSGAPCWWTPHEGTPVGIRASNPAFPAECRTGLRRSHCQTRFSAPDDPDSSPPSRMPFRSPLPPTGRSPFHRRPPNPATRHLAPKQNPLKTDPRPAV